MGSDIKDHLVTDLASLKDGVSQLAFEDALGQHGRDKGGDYNKVVGKYDHILSRDEIKDFYKNLEQFYKHYEDFEFRHKNKNECVSRMNGGVVDGGTN